MITPSAQTPGAKFCNLANDSNSKIPVSTDQPTCDPHDHQSITELARKAVSRGEDAALLYRRALEVLKEQLNEYKTANLHESGSLQSSHQTYCTNRNLYYFLANEFACWLWSEERVEDAIQFTLKLHHEFDNEIDECFFDMLLVVANNFIANNNVAFAESLVEGIPEDLPLKMLTKGLLLFRKDGDTFTSRACIRRALVDMPELAFSPEWALKRVGDAEQVSRAKFAGQIANAWSNTEGAMHWFVKCLKQFRTCRQPNLDSAIVHSWKNKHKRYRTNLQLAQLAQSKQDTKETIRCLRAALKDSEQLGPASSYIVIEKLSHVSHKQSLWRQSPQL